MKNQTTQGLGNKNVLSFPKHESITQILKTKMQYPQSHVDIRSVYQLESLYLDHFPIYQEASGVSKESSYIITYVSKDDANLNLMYLLSTGGFSSFL